MAVSVLPGSGGLLSDLVVMFGVRRGGWRGGAPESGGEVVFAAGLGSHGCRRGPPTGREQHAAPADETPVLEARVEEQGASLQVRIVRSPPSVPSWRRPSPGRAVPGRASDLGEQTRSPERELAARRETFGPRGPGTRTRRGPPAWRPGGSVELLSAWLGSTGGLAS